MGIRIGEEKNRGIGYGKEALAIGLEFCRNHSNLERIGLVVFRNNVRAINAYKAVGFKREGLLKKCLFVDGARVDVVLMAAFRPSRKSTRRKRAELAAARVAIQNKKAVSYQSEAA